MHTMLATGQQEATPATAHAKADWRDEQVSAGDVQAMSVAAMKENANRCDTSRDRGRGRTPPRDKRSPLANVSALSGMALAGTAEARITSEARARRISNSSRQIVGRHPQGMRVPTTNPRKPGRPTSAQSRRPATRKPTGSQRGVARGAKRGRAF